MAPRPKAEFVKINSDTNIKPKEAEISTNTSPAEKTNLPQVMGMFETGMRVSGIMTATMAGGVGAIEAARVASSVIPHDDIPAMVDASHVSVQNPDDAMAKGMHPQKVQPDQVLVPVDPQTYMQKNNNDAKVNVPPENSSSKPQANKNPETHEQAQNRAADEVIKNLFPHSDDREKAAIKEKITAIMPTLKIKDSDLTRASQYEDMIYAAADARGVNRDEMIGVATLESRGIADAVNEDDGGTGLFQFMEGTARDLGLIKADGTDLRKNPGASADAAARYFASMQKLFGQKELDLIAYNSGQGRILNAIKVYLESSGHSADEPITIPQLLGNARVQNEILSVLTPEQKDYPYIVAAVDVLYKMHKEATSGIITGKPAQAALPEARPPEQHKKSIVGKLRDLVGI